MLLTVRDWAVSAVRETEFNGACDCRVFTFDWLSPCFTILFMRRVLVMVVLVLLVAAYISGPLFETVDHWDQFPQSGNDIVLAVVLALTLFALCLCAALKWVGFVSSVSRDQKEDATLAHLQNIFVPSDSLDTSSPLKPCTALRI